MSPLTLALVVCATAATVAIMAVRSRYLLHMFQLEEYDPRRFMRWTFSHCQRLLANVLLDVLAALGILFLALQGPLRIGVTPFYAVAGIMGCAVLVLELRLARRNPIKKAFVATARAKRLLACTLVLMGIAFAGIAVRSWSLALSVSWLLVLLAPFVVVAANVVMMPVQLSERRWYLNDARRVLQGVKPVIVGVTGSYGKTSTKVFLEHLLAGRLNTLATPESYNTVLGICRVIRDQLRPEHQVFIVELAENEAGGYAGLLGLVPCDLSIVTAVGVQHLEEFGTEENIRAVIGDFVRMEQSGQTMILNNDDAFLQSLTEIPGKRLVRVGTVGNGEPSVRAANVQATSEGLAFDLETPDGSRFPCKTAILGRHNVQNILLAATAAHELGLTWEPIVQAIATLQAPQHRLQLMPGAPGVRIIDDAFNANPAGFATAMEVLKSFPPRRILVTPGLVSLGPVEEEENYRAGKRAGEVCDIVVLVGPKQTRALHKGLQAAGFPESGITTVGSLAEVTGLLRTMVKPGDTVLFENDLPDTYNE